MDYIINEKMNINIIKDHFEYFGNTFGKIEDRKFRGILIMRLKNMKGTFGIIYL